MAANKVVNPSHALSLKDWKDKMKCDLRKSAVTANIRGEILSYGEMVQAAYDNLGQQKDNKWDYGYATKHPEEFLRYLNGPYREMPEDISQSTEELCNGQKEHPVPSTNERFRYQLPPATNGLSPLIHARPGKGRGNSDKPKNRIVRAVCEVLPTLGVSFVDGTNGGRALFETRPDGHGTQPRGTFFGYVAVSQPDPTDGGVDVALVWRGTIFKEEWESNFMEEQLDILIWNQWDMKVVPKSHEVGVHAGICDLYTRPIDQLNGSATTIGTTGGRMQPPREVVHTWLRHLLKEHNVKSITATGHSLGGGLATLCAYDVAEYMRELFPTDPEKSGIRDGNWETTAMPDVKMVTFAARALAMPNL